MREIFFRGKRLDNGEWIYGFLIRCNGKINTGKTYIAPCIISIGFDDDYISIGGFIEVDPATVGQYTGLKDKNGKKIFEGDIMRFSAYGQKYVGAVTFMDGSFCILCKSSAPFLDDAIESHDAEKIGNCWDNPELWEEEICK